MESEITRRRFLKGTAGMLVLSLVQLRVGSDRESAASELISRGTEAFKFPGPVKYRGWEDLYRQRWTWDRVAKSTHFVNCWYQRCCSWDVYVKEGVVFREEQAGAYPQTNGRVPDFNPRGCQKGACYSRRMYDPSRLRHPLKRVGSRGEEKWKRISWEQALSEIADATIDALTSSPSLT